MMTDLKREDLVSLVKGIQPYYTVMGNELVSKSGVYTGGFHDKWDWNYKFEDGLTNEQLWNLYILCKESWRK
jgi:hypothetical protein